MLARSPSILVRFPKKSARCTSDCFISGSLAAVGPCGVHNPISLGCRPCTLQIHNRGYQVARLRTTLGKSQDPGHPCR